MTKRARQVGAAVMAIGFVVALGMRSDPDVAVAQRRAPVKATRLFTGPDGQTHAEEIEMKLSPSGTSGELSPTINVNGLQFRRTAPNYFVDWHTAPRRQYVVTLSGKGEIELAGVSGPRTASRSSSRSIRRRSKPRKTRRRGSESDAAADAERARRTALADEARRGCVGERERNVPCIERVPGPDLAEQPLATHAGAEVGQ